LLGVLNDATGTYGTGLMLFAVACAAGAIMLLELGVRWRRTWPSAVVARSGIFNYRGKIAGNVVEGEEGRAA